VIGDIRSLAAAMGQTNAELLLNQNPELLEYRPALRQAHYEIYARHEIAQARQLLQQNWDGPPSFTERANSVSVRVYNRAGDMFGHLDFRNCRRVVLVGCGWVPVTLFYFSDNTDVSELVGLDVNPDAIAAANELARHLGYGRVTAELQNGASYNYGETPIVYVVGMTSPKAAVLSRIADTAPDNVQVIVGEPYSLGLLWGEALGPTLDPRFEVIARGPERAVLSRDLYLRRRPAPPVVAGRNNRTVE
jgi:hypothetical protein